jgi:hypothetical protein
MSPSVKWLGLVLGTDLSNVITASLHDHKLDAEDCIKHGPCNVVLRLEIDQKTMTVLTCEAVNLRAGFTVVERFGRDQSRAEHALLDYRSIFLEGEFEIRRVPGATGLEWAVVQRSNTLPGQVGGPYFDEE